MQNIQEEVKNKIIDWIALGSEGRLIVFKTEKGADLAVQKKGDYPGKKLLFKLEIFITPSEKNVFAKDILQNDLIKEKDYYLLFVVFDEVKQKIEEKIWFMPVLSFIEESEKINLQNNDKALRFDAERFPKYLIDKNELDLFLIDSLIVKNKAKFKGGFKHKQY
jgi:hypothetical protein